jgi:hypothetical protein
MVYHFCKFTFWFRESCFLLSLFIVVLDFFNLCVGSSSILFGEVRIIAAHKSNFWSLIPDLKKFTPRICEVQVHRLHYYIHASDPSSFLPMLSTVLLLDAYLALPVLALDSRPIWELTVHIPQLNLYEDGFWIARGWWYTTWAPLLQFLLLPSLYGVLVQASPSQGNVGSQWVH